MFLLNLKKCFSHIAKIKFKKNFNVLSLLEQLGLARAQLATVYAEKILSKLLIEWSLIQTSPKEY